MNFLQRVDVSNNQLQTLDVSFDPMFRYLNISNNVNLTDLRTTGDNQLTQIVGDWTGLNVEGPYAMNYPGGGPSTNPSLPDQEGTPEE